MLIDVSRTVEEPVANIAAFGAVADGRDNTTAFERAVDAAQAQGWPVYIPPGEWVGTMSIRSLMTYRGAGTGLSTIKAPPNSDGRCMVSEDFDTLTGTTTAGGVYGFTIADISLDGNKANNSGAGSTGDALAIYGYWYKIQNVNIINAKRDGFHSEWRRGSDMPPSSQTLECHVDRMSIMYSDRHCLYLDGPHDSLFENIVTRGANHTNTGTGDGFHIESNGASSHFHNCHAWGWPQRWAWWVDGGSVKVTNSQGEGGLDGQCHVRKNGFRCSDFHLYMPDGGAVSKGLVLGMTTALDGSDWAVSGCIINAQIDNCQAGAIEYRNESNNMIQISVYQDTGTVVVGSPHNNTTLLPGRVQGALSAFTASGKTQLPNGLRLTGANATLMSADPIDGSGTMFNINSLASNHRIELPRGTGLRQFSDGWTTRTFDLAADGTIQFGNAGPKLLYGTGAPEGVKTAPVGSLYLRSDGGASTSLYVKESGTGNTGWRAI